MPKLNETEETPLREKTIYQRWIHESTGFYWLIAEYDPKSKLAFGYANLNNDELAEWGYIDVQELIDVGAVLDEGWRPRKFKEALSLG